MMKMRKPTAVGLRFPLEVAFEGQTYTQTGKLGTHLATLRPTAEYRCGGERLWAFCDGTIAEAHA